MKINNLKTLKIEKYVDIVLIKTHYLIKYKY